MTITRSVPGNETAFLVPSTQCHIFSQEQKVSITAAPEELGVDFVVHTPAPVFQLCYEDEDLHMERRLSVELIDNGGMSMVEILIDKTRNTITEVQSFLTKVSNKGTPYYKTLELESTQIVNVGKMIAALKTRKPNCCTKGRHHLKKTGFFRSLSKRARPPPPPINLDGLIFSVNRNFGSGRTPPLRDEINPKKFQSFSVNRNFGLGQTPPSPFRINSEIKKYFFMSKKKYFEKFKKKTEYLMKKQSI